MNNENIPDASYTANPKISKSQKVMAAGQAMSSCGCLIIIATMVVVLIILVLII